MTLENRINQIKLEKELIQNKLNSLPQSKFFIGKKGQYTQWFESVNGERFYIPKKDRHYAEKLALKKYYSEKLKILQQFLNKLYQVSSTEEKLNNLDYEFMSEDSPYRELLETSIQNFDKEIEEWIQSPCPENTYEVSNKKIHTADGNRVRSKSEAMIADALYFAGIPYKYECSLDVNGKTIFPDFTVINIREKKMYYWEHFGMMDNIEYCDKAYKKLFNYSVNGFIPGINLITTYETNDSPLDSVQIRNVIDEYLK